MNNSLEVYVKYEELLSRSNDNILNSLCRKKAILILLLLKQHKLRNKELIKKLGRISPSTLSSLLRSLTREGLIRRRVYGEIPPVSTEYSLTNNGKQLLIAMGPLLNWIIYNR